MKADGIGITIIDDIVGQTHYPRTVKNIKTTSPLQSPSSKAANEPVASIELADQIADDISKKLQEMSNLLIKIRDEKNDIIREQLARFFNILKVYIKEALHPTGNWSTDQIMSGKSIKVGLGTDGAHIVVQGERIDNTKIRELSKSSTSEEIEAMQLSIKNAQASVKKLRNNIASARSQIIHHSSKSSEIIL